MSGPSATPEGLAASYYASRLPNVVFEESENEVVVVNLLSGVYYFLTGTAAFVWLALHSGMTVNEAALDLRSAAPAEVDVDQDVQVFVAKLLALDLVEAIAANISHDTDRPVLPSYVSTGYSAPTLESFADLQDILLLDPVHDVDETGWPHAKA